MPFSVSTRPLTPEELERLRAKRPPLIFWPSRKVANQELALAVGEQLDFEVLRAWNANPCEPPCCPPRFLFQASPDEYVSVDFEDLPDTPLAEIPRRTFKILRSPRLKIIVSWSATGERVPVEPTDLGIYGRSTRGSLVPSASIFAECELFRLSDFNDELREKLHPGGGKGGRDEDH
jgi:hypothetical protein